MQNLWESSLSLKIITKDEFFWNILSLVKESRFHQMVKSNSIIPRFPESINDPSNAFLAEEQHPAGLLYDVFPSRVVTQCMQVDAF